MINKTENGIFIHAGLNKTGSTYLQKHFFPFLKGVVYTDPFGNDFSISLHNVLKNPGCLDRLRLLISCEGFLMDTIPDAPTRIPARSFFLKNLIKVFPHARFIICFRKQECFLESSYAQYLQMGGVLHFNNFFGIHNENGYIRSEDIFYGSIIDMVEQLYDGPHFFYDYDDFCVKKKEVLYQMAELIGVEPVPFRDVYENVSTGKIQMKILRQLNKLSRTNLNPNGLLPFSLGNSIFQKLGISPRSICQDKLAFLSNEKWRLPSDIKSSIREYYENDWNYVKSKCRSFL